MAGADMSNDRGPAAVRAYRLAQAGGIWAVQLVAEEIVPLMTVTIFNVLDVVVDVPNMVATCAREYEAVERSFLEDHDGLL